MDKRLKAAYISVISNTVLTILKISVGLFSRSLAILSEGLHSGSDIIASLVACLSIKEAIKPPDERHPFGHGKYECLSGIIEGVLITLIGFLIVYESICKLLTKRGIEFLELGIGVMLLSTVVNFFISKYLFKIASQTDSLALKADAWHLRADYYTSIGVFVGLIIIRITGFLWLDSLIAIGIAIWLMIISVKLIKESVSGLLDEALPSGEEELIKDIISKHNEYFVEFHNLRTRKSGAERHIDLHLVVRKNITIKQSHSLCDHLEKEIERKLPNCKILIHTEPE